MVSGYPLHRHHIVFGAPRFPWHNSALTCSSMHLKASSTSVPGRWGCCLAIAVMTSDFDILIIRRSFAGPNLLIIIDLFQRIAEVELLSTPKIP